MDRIIFTFIISFAATLFVIPLIIKVAKKFKIGAVTTRHSIHKSFVPTLGGVGIFFGFFVGFFFAKFVFSYVDENFFNHFLGIVIGSFLILIEGIYDDIKGVNYIKKFAFQITASLIVIYYGYKIEVVSNPFGSDLSLGVFSIPLTILWITGITNAINLIDGLDGLAAGIGAIISTTFIIITFKLGDFSGNLLSMLLLATMLAFLLYNFNPAKVFMGDVGSQLIGFIIACISIDSFFQLPSSPTVFIPIIALGIPIIDTILAFLRRIITGVHPFRGDKEHIHHYMLNMNIGYKKTVFYLYGATLFLGISCILLVILSKAFITPILIVVCLFVFVALLKLGYPRQLYLIIRNKRRNSS